MKNTKLTLSEVAEKNITTFNQDNFLNHEIGQLNDGNEVAYEKYQLVAKKEQVYTADGTWKRIALR